MALSPGLVGFEVAALEGSLGLWTGHYRGAQGRLTDGKAVHSTDAARSGGIPVSKASCVFLKSVIFIL